MSIDVLADSRLAWSMQHEPRAAWVFIALVGCLALRAWLFVQCYRLPRELRGRAVAQGASLGDTLGNAALLLGVIGTLVGITLAVSGAESDSPSAVLDAFSRAYATAVSTTIAGGLSYVLISLLGSLEQLLWHEP